MAVLTPPFTAKGRSASGACTDAPVSVLRRDPSDWHRSDLPNVLGCEARTRIMVAQFLTMNLLGCGHRHLHFGDFSRLRADADWQAHVALISSRPSMLAATTPSGSLAQSPGEPTPPALPGTVFGDSQALKLWDPTEPLFQRSLLLSIPAW